MRTLLVFSNLKLLFWWSTILLLLAAVVLASEEEAGGTATNETSEASNSTTSEEEATEPYYAVLFPWFATAIGIVVFFIQTRYVDIGIPYTCIMFIIGLFMGLGAVLSGLDDQLTVSISQWTNINAEVLFLVFLPGLLFKDSFEINFHLFVASFWQQIILAFPVVLAGTALTAVVALYVFPYDWTFYHSMTFGSILSATDPVAIAALLNELGGPPRLKMHIAGESLLNDGSAIVFFTVFAGSFLYELDIGLGETTTVAEGFARFFQMSLGGMMVGIVFGMALVLILFLLDRRFEKEEVVLQVTATVTLAYLSFYVADVVCHTSGVISVVSCGVYLSAFGRGLISDWNVMDSFWALLEHLLNTVIFTLGGIQFGKIIANTHGDWTGADWGYLFVLYILLNAIRFFLLFAVYPINSRIGLSTTWQETLFSCWAGLRGAVGIALALGLDNAVTARTTDPQIIMLTTKTFGMVGGMAFLTLVINAPTSAWLLKKLGLVDSTEARKRIVKQVEDSTRCRMLDDFLQHMMDPRFHFVDFALVMHHCPPLRDLAAKELGDAVEMNRNACHPDLYKEPNLHYVLPYVPDSDHLRSMGIETPERDVLRDSAKAALDMARNSASSAVRRENFFNLGTLDDIAESSTPTPPNPDLIIAIRLMFIELLRAAYQSQIQDGELDPREYNGYLSYVLLQSCEFAHDGAVNGLPLDDWKQSTGLSSALVYRSQDAVKRLYACCCVSGKCWHGKTEEGVFPRAPKGKSPSMVKELWDERFEALSDKRFKYQQMRLDVLRAFSFIDAHSEAEERLKDEFGDGAGDNSAAFHAVMEESRAQVKKAKDVLQAKNKKQLKHVISHHLCIILQNKRARYIKVLLDSGVLLHREARHYLEEIDKDIIDIRNCPLEEHPGAIVIEEMMQQVKPRRRRVKQKSLL